MEIRLTEQIVKALIEYLAQRPYYETHQMISLLQAATNQARAEMQAQADGVLPDGEYDGE